MREAQEIRERGRELAESSVERKHKVTGMSLIAMYPEIKRGNLDENRIRRHKKKLEQAIEMNDLNNRVVRQFVIPELWAVEWILEKEPTQILE